MIKVVGRGSAINTPFVVQNFNSFGSTKKFKIRFVEFQNTFCSLVVAVELIQLKSVC
jgi:hypothetical protein